MFTLRLREYLIWWMWKRQETKIHRVCSRWILSKTTTELNASEYHVALALAVSMCTVCTFRFTKNIPTLARSVYTNNTIDTHTMERTLAHTRTRSFVHSLFHSRSHMHTAAETHTHAHSVLSNATSTCARHEWNTHRITQQRSQRRVFSLGASAHRCWAHVSWTTPRISTQHKRTQRVTSRNQNSIRWVNFAAKTCFVDTVTQSRVHSRIHTHSSHGEISLKTREWIHSTNERLWSGFWVCIRNSLPIESFGMNEPHSWIEWNEQYAVAATGVASPHQMCNCFVLFCVYNNLLNWLTGLFGRSCGFRRERDRNCK